MKSKENDTYSKNLMKTYIQGPFSGSNIRSRYINNRYDKKEGESQIEYTQEEEEGDNDEVSGSEKVERPPQKKAEEEDICPIKLIQGEKTDVISFYSMINPDSISLKLVSKQKKQREHFFFFNPDD